MFLSIHTRCSVLFAAWVWWLTLVAVASAQPAAEEPGYEQLLAEAVSAHQAGHWLEARTLFERANTLEPNARALRGMGVCAFEAGLYSLAIHDLEASLSHPVRPLSDELRHAVEVLLAHVRAEVATYRFQLDPEDSELRVDDAAPLRDESGAVLLDPGEHRAVVTHEGHVAQTVQIAAQRGEQRDIRIILPWMPQPAAPAELPVPAPGVELNTIVHDVPPRSESGAPALSLRGWALGTGGLSVLSLATAGALYGGAQGRIRDIARECRRQTDCTTSEAHTKREQHNLPRFERSIDATLVVGAVLATVSIVLWVLDMRARRQRTLLANGALGLRF